MKFRKSFLFVKFFVYARTIAAVEELVYPGKVRIYLPYVFRWPALVHVEHGEPRPL
jgi:hypothetical protein